MLVVLRRHSVATGNTRICGIHSAEGGARGHWAVPDTQDVFAHTFILHIYKSSSRNAEDMRFAFKLQLSKFTKRASPLLTPSFSLSRRLLPIRRQETDVTMSRQSGGGLHFFLRRELYAQHRHLTGHEQGRREAHTPSPTRQCGRMMRDLKEGPLPAEPNCRP